MVEEQEARIQDAFTKVVDEIDKSHLRKIQADMHHCAARCCENTTDSLERIHHCIEKCSVRLNNAQNFVQSEFTNLQNRLQRCVMECNDNVKDKLGTYPSDNEVSKYTTEFEDCAMHCVDKHVSLLPSLLKKMKEVLSKGVFEGKNDS